MLRSVCATVAICSLLAACGSSGSGPSDGGSKDGGAKTDAGDAGAGAPNDGGQAAASRGTIAFHLLLGVSGQDTPGDTLSLDGDKYTDLIASSFIAGVLYGHLIQTYTPGMQFDKDYLYGSIFGQLLQENIETEAYTGTEQIDPSSDQAAVMGTGQGGPFQINNYAVDLVYGGYAPEGYSLINYVALQKNIGYSFASAATQHAAATPPIFNDKHYGPLLTAYFHFNDYVALQEIGPVNGSTPGWEPDYDETLTNFVTLPDNFLDVLLNVAYNQGYYGLLVTAYSQEGASATTSTVASVDDYGSVWGSTDTYRQYPYQVRYYLDQLFDNPAPLTGVVPDNHLVLTVAGLGAIFADVFETLAYVDASSSYVPISATQATAAFAAALAQSSAAGSTALDLSDAGDRAKIYDLLERAIGALETGLPTDFTARTTTAL